MVANNNYIDPDILYQNLCEKFKNSKKRTAAEEELWISSLFLCFYNREFGRQFMIYNNLSNKIERIKQDEKGIDVQAKDSGDDRKLNIQVKQFPVSNTILARKNFKREMIISPEAAEQYILKNTEEIKSLTINYLKQKLRNDYDFVIIYLNTEFEAIDWINGIIGDTGLEKSLIRNKEVWLFKNEKITISGADCINKAKATIKKEHYYKFFKIYPEFSKYSYCFIT